MTAGKVDNYYVCITADPVENDHRSVYNLRQWLHYPELFRTVATTIYIIIFTNLLALLHELAASKYFCRLIFSVFGLSQFTDLYYMFK